MRWKTAIPRHDCFSTVCCLVVVPLEKHISAIKSLFFSIVEQSGFLQYTVDILLAFHTAILELGDLMDERTGKVNKAIRDLVAALVVRKDGS